MEGSSHRLMSYIGIWMAEENDGWPVLVVKILTLDPLSTMPDFDITSVNGSING
jgi:hypothetical protein